MTRQLFAAFLLIAVSLQTFNRGLIVSGYYLKAYVKNCENKAKPQMHCNGRCQMLKKLKTEEDRDKQNVTGLKFNDVVSSKSFFGTVQLTYSEFQPSYGHSLTQRTIDFPSTTFHPPGMIA